MKDAKFKVTHVIIPLTIPLSRKSKTIVTENRSVVARDWVSRKALTTNRHGRGFGGGPGVMELFHTLIAIMVT